MSSNSFHVKPFSQACENNKTPILDILQRVFADSKCVLEIGSGTGQHAVHFAANLPDLVWQTSDIEENHEGIRAWLEDEQLENTRMPITLDMNKPNWPSGFDAVFSANTAHIMSWPLTCEMIKGVGENLSKGGLFALYGPFNYNGEYTSESNARFDIWLKEASPTRGIRHFEEVNALASEVGLTLLEDNAMPANNRLLLWRKEA